MKGTKLILSFLAATVFAVFLAGTLQTVAGINPFITGGLSLAAAIIPKPAGILPMSVNVEIWHKYIEENLFSNNEFLLKSVDVSSDVLNGKIVHIPQAGSPSGVKRNRTNLPAQIKRRADSDVLYSLDEFTSDPILIKNAEKIELSYDKVGSVLSNDMSNIKQVMSEWMLYNWFKTAKYIKTTGDAVASHLPGTTGNRKKVTLENVEELQALFDENNVPEAGRNILLDARMYQQFINQLGANDMKDFSSFYNPQDGVVGKLFSFNFMKRSRAGVLSSAFVLAEPDSAIAVNSVAGAFAWQESKVERAVGEIKMFENIDDPTYYGDVYSFLVNAGGRARNAESKGIYILAQDQA